MLPGVGGIAGFAGGPVLSLSDETIEDFDIASSTATLTILNNGTIAGIGNVDDFTSNWITPASAAGNAYEVRVSFNSGDTPSGTLGSWLGLGTNRSWALSEVGLGSKTCELLAEIRSASTMVVLATAAYTLTANVTP